MPLPPPPPAHVQLLTGADVWTSQGPQKGQAVAIQKGRILAVGPLESLARSHPKAERVDLPGGTLLPGLIEGHAHVGGLGALGWKVDLVGLDSLPETLGRIREWAAAHPEGWLQGRGWDQNRWPAKGFPRALDLDALIGGRPVCLQRVDGHAVWVNTAALAIAGIGPDTPDPQGGRILKDAYGRPNGILLDAAMDLVTKHIPAPTDAEVEARLRAGLLALRADGFTAVADMGVDGRELAAYRRLAEAGTLPIRVFAYLAHDHDLMLRELRPGKHKPLSFFQVQGVKFYLDGALGSRGARLLAPYADEPATKGLWVTDPARVGADAAITLRAGYQPAIHAIGDAANRAALDLLAEAMKKGKGALPPRIEHAQIVTAEDAARFGKLGVVASVQPVHCTSDHSWTPARLGPGRVDEAFPWRSFVAGGALLAFGSDAPVEDANPFVSLAAAETRQDPQGDPPGGFLPGQRLSRMESVRAYTGGNATALGRAKELGTLQKGAVADLLWVQAPLGEITPEALRKVRPGRLWVNGAEVPVRP
ncbi:MAG: amidohydrolase [Geothrix sp.]|uniref:amidohydrolase n=1 Tax=Geothrix sp. TaxID=1962974 RepID=UPI0017D5FB3F|nr:amidohydrolase [Geothrix sp.]NWJ39358.1 amidohydrolase [Geothrix sp.]WIL19417.1 MAG: amidohydrolase [Geothrix sp.]